MLTNLLISVLSDDKPGVVETLAETISRHGGNWLESRLSQLAGKFAGVVRIALEQENVAALEEQLQELQAGGIWIKTEKLSNENKTTTTKKAFIHALGPDRPGIVLELSKALAKSHINLAVLETSLSSMPYSGEPLFDATGELEIPLDYDMDELHAAMTPLPMHWPSTFHFLKPHSNLRNSYSFNIYKPKNKYLYLYISIG